MTNRIIFDHASGVGRPAGCSSSEDEWEMDNENEDLTETFPEPSLSLQKSSSYISSDSANTFKTSDASQREFVWTKNSCARRPDATKKGPPPPPLPPPVAADAGPVPDENEFDFDISKCRRDFAANRVMVNMDWVEKKLNEAVTDSKGRSAVPKGSPEVTDG